MTLMVGTTNNVHVYLSIVPYDAYYLYKRFIYDVNATPWHSSIMVGAINYLQRHVPTSTRPLLRTMEYKQVRVPAVKCDATQWKQNQTLRYVVDAILKHQMSHIRSGTNKTMYFLTVLVLVFAILSFNIMPIYINLPRSVFIYVYVSEQWCFSHYSEVYVSHMHYINT